MRKNLKAFLAEWLAWAEGDAPDDKPFKRRRGLCASFEYWLDARDINYRDISDELDLLTQALKDDGLDECYPFGGVELFYDESDADEMHLNEARLAWVRSKVEQFAAEARREQPPSREIGTGSSAARTRPKKPTGNRPSGWDARSPDVFH